MDDKKGRFNPINMNELTRDAFRTLRQNISFSGGDEDVKTVVVTSSVPNEGKTSVSIGLGISMAESMKNTLIIECDCRRPSVGNRLKLRPKTNWIDVIYQHESLESAIVPTDVKNLYFLDAEPGLVHSVEFLSSGRFWDMVERIKKSFDFIIFDTPPLGSFIDAAVLSKRADGVVIVVSSGSREIRLLKEIIEQLKKANAKMLGVVLNRVNSHRSSYYRYGDYYYRNQGKHKTAGKRLREKKKEDEESPESFAYEDANWEKEAAAEGETPKRRHIDGEEEVTARHAKWDDGDDMLDDDDEDEDEGVYRTAKERAKAKGGFGSRKKPAR